MDFADWDVDVGQTNGVSFEGGNDGTDEQNANLASPLVLQGTDCRKFWATTNGLYSVRYNLNAGSFPDFSGIPDTKAISVRAWVRKVPQISGRHNAVVIHAKGSTLDGNGRVNGYSLAYGKDAQDGMLELASGAAYDGLSLILKGTNDNGAYFRAINITTLPVNTWHQIRLDVIPTKNGVTVDRDTVRVYVNTGTEASPVWSLVYEKVFLLVDAYASPWGNATFTRVGFAAFTDGDTATPANRTGIYIDRWECLLKTIP
jgi:hypothetical protein